MCKQKTHHTPNDPTFLKKTPFLPTLPFYGNNLNPSFWVNFENTNPHFIKGENFPTMYSSNQLVLGLK